MKISKGLIIGFIIGIVLSLLHFIPVINLIPLFIGATIDWFWEISFRLILGYEIYQNISIYNNLIAQSIIMIVLFSILGASYSNKKKWIKITGIVISVLFFLTILARFIIFAFLLRT